ncbi:MAG: V-type ATPase subunit [Nitrospinae bacterium]|nr:V-type ATPase subunit [Nitrospinota bacterium]
MIDYAVTRLAALKSRFPGVDFLVRVVETRDAGSLLSLLSDTVFKEEAESFIAKSETKITLPIVLRAAHNGHIRLRRFFSRLVKQAFPEAFSLLLARWELEEVKAALRYLSSGGAAYERRFTFISYMLDAKPGHLWEADKTPAQFLASLEHKGHPLASFFDPELYSRDRVRAELEMERNFFNGFIPEKSMLLKPSQTYFQDQLDLLNIHNAFLLRESPLEEGNSEQIFISGPGRITEAEFMRIAKGAPGQAANIARKKIGINLDPAFETSSIRFSRELKKALLHGYRMKNLLEPSGIWAFLYFMEGMEAMVADLKLAIYFGSAGAPPEQALEQFCMARE